MGLADIPLDQTAEQPQRSKLTMDTITNANTHIPPMHASLACAEAEVTLGSFSPWSLGSAIATWGTTRPEGDEKGRKKVERDSRKQTKQTW